MRRMFKQKYYQTYTSQGQGRLYIPHLTDPKVEICIQV